MKRAKIDLESALERIKENSTTSSSQEGQKKNKTLAENLDLDYYVQLLPKIVADELFCRLEDSVEYYKGELTKVKVFGKWHPVPRQQVAYGDEGMKYRFSGTTIPAITWTPTLEKVKDLIESVTRFSYNFVLINRYKDGNDHMGEHRDDEAELDKTTPIASLSLGQHRTFVLKHADCRKKGESKRNVPLVKMELQHGRLLMMNPPTNEHWYHSLPPRKSAPGVRINLTFRKINSSSKKRNEVN